MKCYNSQKGGRGWQKFEAKASSSLFPPSLLTMGSCYYWSHVKTPRDRFFRFLSLRFKVGTFMKASSTRLAISVLPLRILGSQRFEIYAVLIWRNLSGLGLRCSSDQLFVPFAKVFEYKEANVVRSIFLKSLSPVTLKLRQWFPHIDLVGWMTLLLEGRTWSQIMALSLKWANLFVSDCWFWGGQKSGRLTAYSTQWVPSSTPTTLQRTSDPFWCNSLVQTPLFFQLWFSSLLPFPHPVFSSFFVLIFHGFLISFRFRLFPSLS